MALKNQPDGKTGQREDHAYNLDQALTRFERGFLSNILELTRWNRAKAAQMLGISENLLASKIRDYQLSPADRPSSGGE